MRQTTIPGPRARATLLPIAALMTASLAVSQDPAVAQSEEIRGGAVDASTGEVLPRWRAPALDLPTVDIPTVDGRLPIRGPQDDPYSVTGLLSDMHGEFLANAFAFRHNLAISYRAQGKNELSGEDGSYSWQQARVEAFAPMPLDPDMLLITGLRLNGRGFDFSADSGVEDEILYETALHLGLGRFVTEDLYIEAVFRPGLYSDFDGTLTRDDWKFYADVIGTYQFDPGFFGKFGVVYDGTFEDAPVYPVVGFSLMMDQGFRLDLLLPKSLELAWNPNPSWILKLGLAVDGEQYRVRTTPLMSGDKIGFDVRTQELDLYLDGTLRFSDNLGVFGRVGATLVGKNDWSYPGNPYDGQSGQTVFAELGVGFSF